VKLEVGNGKTGGRFFWRNLLEPFLPRGETVQDSCEIKKIFEKKKLKSDRMGSMIVYEEY
jgi:hypothetical protein